MEKRMSSFWEKRGLVPGQSQPVVQQQQNVPAVLQNQAWWQPNTPSPQPTQQLVQQPQQPQQELVAEYSTTKATASRKGSNCPECNSGDFMTMPGIKGVNGSIEAYRCFDCGWPIIQSSSGDSMPSTRGKDAVGVRPTQQIAGAGLGGVSNYNPGVIIGTV
jgi:hypothetical protein